MEKVIWESLQQEAREAGAKDKFLADYLEKVILCHTSLFSSLASLLAENLERFSRNSIPLKKLFLDILGESPDAEEAVLFDLEAIRSRDPASKTYMNPFLNYKGFHALESYRAAHQLWLQDRKDLALLLQSWISDVYGVDIHPAARIGKGLLIDHATGIVIGETSVVGDDVSMLQGVTLGGTGKETGDRHPKVGKGVLLGAGAKVLGNITIGEGAKIGAGSVVLKNIPPHRTAVGVPARVTGRPRTDFPSLDMNQMI